MLRPLDQFRVDILKPLSLWGIDLSFTLGILMGTVNAGAALSLQSFEYLKRDFTIPIQKFAHLLAPILWQRWEE